jgi:serine/alanine adding enzyme
MMMKTYTLTTNDAERWRQILPAEVSVTRGLDYVRICEQQTGWAARLFVVELGQPVAAYPYLLRPVQTLPVATGIGRVCFDTCTPEYAGPIWLNGGLPEGAPSPSFTDLFAAHCREQGIIAEFAHLNPWISERLLESACVNANREIVYVDLTQTEEQIWLRSFSSDARRQTKQGLKAGVQIRRAVTADDVREFYRLYIATMDRRQAADRYYFPLEYFLAFFETMSANSFFVLAEHEGRVVAGGLFLHDARTVFWHLSASDRDLSNLRGVNVYLHHTIRHSLGKGWQRMILGGAYEAGDGVFRFKANFSPLRARFNTYQRVHDAETYTALVQAWRVRHSGMESGDNFFPAYRATPVAAPDCGVTLST